MKQVVLKGSLAYLNLGEMIQLIGSNSSTGVLRIHSPYSGGPGLIQFDKGNPVDAEAGNTRGLDAAYALFGWLDGEFEFSLEPVTAENVIKKNRMEIVLDGLRMLDDGLIKKLGPEHTKATVQVNESKEIPMPLIKGPLVDYMYVVDEEEFFDGDEIVIEGKHGSWIWVILEGQVEIVKKTEHGALRILKVGEGAFLGSIAALLEGDARSATTVAAGHVQLGVLDAQRLSAEFTQMSPLLRNIMLSMDRRMRQVTEHAVNIYLQRNDLKRYIAGKRPLIRQGEDEQRLFTITCGEADIIRKKEKIFVPLARLGKDDFIGPLPFVDMGHEPNSASVLASDALKLAPLDVSTLQREHDRLSNTVKNLIQHMATSISVTSRLACQFKEKIVAEEV